MTSNNNDFLTQGSVCIHPLGPPGIRMLRMQNTDIGKLVPIGKLQALIFKEAV